MNRSLTLSAATQTYGVPDPTSIQEVVDLWERNRDCNWHAGAYSYANRTAIEKEQPVPDIHFRYNKLADMVILEAKGEAWYTVDGKGMRLLVCDFACRPCGVNINPDWQEKHDGAYHNKATDSLIVDIMTTDVSKMSKADALAMIERCRKA